MIEVQPIEKELTIIDEVINDYKNEIINLEKEQKEKKDELANLLNKEKGEEKNNYDIKLESNKRKKEEDLKINEAKYLSDLEDIKREYENKIKLRKNKYLEDNEITINKYKLKKEKLNSEYNLQIEKLDENYREIIHNLKYITKIEKNENMLKLNQIIYNSYKNFKNFYNSSLNINNLLLFYSNNKDINDKMRNILGSEYDEIMTERKKKFNVSSDEKIKKLEEENNKNKRIYDNNIREYSGEIIIRYKINKGEKKVKIFGNEFINNNKNKCKIIYEGKEFEIKERWNINKIKKKY
jgi:hypothetical protein